MGGLRAFWRSEIPSKYLLVICKAVKGALSLGSLAQRGEMTAVGAGQGLVTAWVTWWGQD